jgi:hypothetical protein
LFGVGRRFKTEVGTSRTSGTTTSGARSRASMTAEIEFTSVPPLVDLSA